MPSYAQLENEAAWRDEIVPAELARMGRTVRTALGLSPDAVGFKGNNLHLNGAHRSRRWILTSDWCTDRTYTVSYADDKLGDQDWIAGFDISAPPHILLPMCQRLDAAVRAGRLEELAAWYGNLDGDQRVDGYNNILNRVSTSDSSHLTHLHGTVLRRHANNAAFMARLAAVLIGDDMLKDETLPTLPAETLATGDVLPAESRSADVALAYALRNSYAARRAAEAALAKLAAGMPVALPDAQLDLLADKLAARLPAPAVPPTAETIAKAVVAETARELTD
ncbi:hypothetical protein Rhe02_55000 [Rhizocola hellebori]|uniref:Uncharacterized protein n=1 Tax=Rhizocola hellebori TaxID=1392758 RepID=A0A8J3QCZ6_9ACTN|nr:hypothetical protein [Rhizocola hellebori]GIH07433.1 hypothetical protein Rhe02_55000 [Rhizocola hellebori]